MADRAPNYGLHTNRASATCFPRVFHPGLPGARPTAAAGVSCFRGRMVGAAAVATLAAMVAAVPADAAGDPIMPLGDVQVGMTGTARTVVSGTQIVTFPVTVIDVTRSGDGIGAGIILVRAEGPLMKQTGGIAQGMSGSPVYITGADGVQRVVGALAYGLEDEENVLGGITPIEEMLRNTTPPRALSRPTTAPPRVPTLIADTPAQADALRRRHPDARVLSPLVRWTVGGLDPRLTGVLQRRLGSGVQVTNSGPVSLRPRVTLVPGASLAAQLLSGPVSIGAVGTVTYVDGPTVLGFGHPFLGGGAESLLMADAHINATVPAPIKGQSFKMGEAGTVQGNIVNDRRAGIVGRMDTPVGVKMVVDARDTQRQTHIRNESLIAPQPELLGLMADLAGLEPLLRVRDGVGTGTLRTSITVEADGFPTIRYRNVYAAQGDVVALAAGKTGALIGRLVDNPYRVYRVRSITVDQTIEPTIDAGTIVAARSVPAVVRRGGTARMVLTVRRWRGATQKIVVPYRVPASLSKGAVMLRVVPHNTDGWDDSAPDLMSALIQGKAVLPLRARPAALSPRAEVSAEKRVRKAVDELTNDRHDAVRILAPGDDADEPKEGFQAGTKGTVIIDGRAGMRVRVR